jgi:asparagine synthase (glutamine-hydrolysing)
VRAGEIVTVNAADGVVAREIYRVFTYSRTPELDADAVAARFDSALAAGMDRLIARADGRQLVVPLSGGLDSRLISAYLKLAGYENVINFTYGRPEGREAGLSKQVAEALGQRWRFVPYPPSEIAAAWAGKDAARFIEFAHSASALPHVQDWYALVVLNRDRLIDNDAIMLPGHTIVGNIHDTAILDDAEPVAASRLKEVLIDYHYGLQGRSRAMRDDPSINAEFDEVLHQIGYDGSVLARAEAMEYFNLSERQAKYINNSMRVYEFFGYEWALPMLDTEMYLMWQTLDIKFTRDRSWYRQYVDGWFSRAADVDVDYFAPMTMSANKRNALKSALARMGLERAAQRLLTARAVLQHHMSFNRFVGSMSQAELGWRTLRGQTLLGIYADLFLRDTWNPHTHVFH